MANNESTERGERVVRVEEHEDRPGQGFWYRRRISWGAIIAGAIIVIMVQLTLALLGLAIGLSTVDPMQEQQPTEGFFTGEMIWWVISGLIALFCGGVAAARLSGLRTGLLHGLVTWGLVTLLSIWMLTSAVGTIIGGAFATVRSSIAAAAEAVPECVSVSTGQDGKAADANSVWLQIQDEVRQMLKQTGKEELQPEQLEQEAEQAQETVTEAAKEAAKQPQQAYDEIMQALDKLLRQAMGVASEVDREAAVNVLVKRTDMSREEAQKTVDRWIEAYQEATKELAQTAKEVKKEAAQTVAKVSPEAVDVATAAAWWSFGMLVLGAIAAAVGGVVGMLGNPKPEWE